MDIKRNALILALAIVSYMLLLAWNEDFPAQNGADTSAQTEADLSVPAVNLPATDGGDLPQAPATAAATARAPVATAAQTLITVTTPSQVVTIDPLGGDIVNITLPKYPASLDRQDDPFNLMYSGGRGVYVAQSGLIGRDGPDAAPTGRPRFQAVASTYQLDEGELAVDLVHTTANDVEITKRFIFTADDYLIGVQYLIANRGSSEWSGNLFAQIKRDRAPDPSSVSGFGINTYLGAVFTSIDDPYVRVDFDDMDDDTETTSMPGGWIGFSQHYFLGGWIGPETVMNRYETRRNATTGEYLMGFVSAPSVAAAGQQTSIETALWAGPKDQYRLEAIAPDLGLTIDYGKLWFVAYPIFWLLSQINSQVGNFGWSIILLTLVIRMAFYPLSAKQYQSQASMKRLQPKIAQLKERYGDDKQKFMQAQMELWKKEGVNPFGGCLPVLLQMPVFLGIYWVLNESVELRQASFIFWYEDLSTLDPYFILPLLLGGAYYLQQHMMPMMTTDPTQAKVMKFMPVMFTVFFLWFPAGLVLYYLVNALLGILQQWYFTWRLERSASARAGD
jgi:YidC/Oxa1 family membrane protein insertase